MAIAAEPVQNPPLRDPGPRQAPAPAISSAELAECTCPEFCERDHDND